MSEPADPNYGTITISYPPPVSQQLRMVQIGPTGNWYDVWANRGVLYIRPVLADTFTGKSVKSEQHIIYQPYSLHFGFALSVGLGEEVLKWLASEGLKMLQEAEEKPCTSSTT